MGFLTVLLTILKIIGFIIAALIGLILIILSLVLFVPVRYHGYAKYKGKPEVMVKASYLFHIVSARFTLKDNKTDLKIKIFWHTLGKKKTKKVKKVLIKEVENKNENTEASKENKADINSQESKSTVNDSFTFESQKDYETVKDAPAIINKKKKKRKKEKISIFKRIKDIYNNIRNKYRLFKNKRDEIFKEINDEGNRSAVKLLLASVGKLLKHSLPQKHRIKILFGTGDPASTGELLGAMYAAGVLLYLNLVITPDFENKVFECEAVFKGRIRAVNVLVIVLKAYRDKNIKKLIRRAKNYGR